MTTSNPGRRRARGLVAVLVLAIMAAAGSAYAFDAARDDSEPAAVTMGDASFSPATVRVKAGESVTWKNASQLTHTATGSGFDSGNVEPGKSWSHTFEKPGTYAYHCVPHEAAGMKGTVIVE